MGGMGFHSSAILGPMKHVFLVSTVEGCFESYWAST